LAKINHFSKLIFPKYGHFAYFLRQNRAQKSLFFKKKIKISPNQNFSKFNQNISLNSFSGVGWSSTLFITGIGIRSFPAEISETKIRDFGYLGLLLFISLRDSIIFINNWLEPFQ